jgi:hypothetical protein
MNVMRYLAQVCHYSSGFLFVYHSVAQKCEKNVIKIQLSPEKKETAAGMHQRQF